MGSPYCAPGRHRLRFDADGWDRRCDACPYIDGRPAPARTDGGWQRGTFSPRDGRRISAPGEFDSVSLGGGW